MFGCNMVTYIGNMENDKSHCLLQLADKNQDNDSPGASAFGGNIIISFRNTKHGKSQVYLHLGDLNEDYDSKERTMLKCMIVNLICNTGME